MGNTARMDGRMEDGIEAEIAAWLGVDLTDPVQRLANDLARGDREFLDELIAHRRGSATQGEIADRMGVSQSAVSQFEAGDRDPQLSTIRRYALALGVMVEHRVVEAGRAELIRDEAVRAIAGLRDATSPAIQRSERRPRRGAAVTVDGRGAHVAAAAFSMP